MKSVGEAMAIGRNFQESLQKAIRSLESNHDGFTDMEVEDNFEQMVQQPSPDRLFYLGQAFREGYSINQVFNLSKIDPWFLSYIKEIIDLETETKKQTLDKLDKDFLRQLKKRGFSDSRIAILCID